MMTLNHKKSIQNPNQFNIFFMLPEVIGMSIKHLKQIREQEELADKIRKDGLLESKRIVSSATEDAATLIERAKSEANVLYKEAIEKSAKEAELDYDREIQQANKECDMLSDHAKKNLEKAVSLIIRKVMN